MSSEAPGGVREMAREMTRAGLTRPRVGGKALPPLQAFLRTWQSHRLATTYPDLLASKQYGSACRFFLSDIYAPRDFTQRDADINRLVGIMRRALPEPMIRGAVAAVELNDLSNELDERLMEVLRSELSVRDSFTQEQYEEAYRLCYNYEERVRQIDLLVECGQRLASVHHLPFARRALSAARMPARLFGWREMYDFLRRGYEAWLPVRDAEPMLRVIREREMAVLNRIYRVETGSDVPVG